MGLVNISIAQESNIGNWLIYFGNQQISKKWNWWNEIQYRNFNFIGDLEQLLFRTGFGYDLSENNNNLLLGYGFILSRPYIDNSAEKTETTEHRIYQQFITRQDFGRVFIQHRYRLEERFLETDFRIRLRYLLSLNIPLNKPRLEKSALYFSAYNELFLHFDKPVFDRDRVYGAFGYVINKYFRMEIGIMYQIYETTNRPQLQIVFFNSIPFSK